MKCDHICHCGMDSIIAYAFIQGITEISGRELSSYIPSPMNRGIYSTVLDSNMVSTVFYSIDFLDLFYKFSLLMAALLPFSIRNEPKFELFTMSYFFVLVLPKMNLRLQISFLGIIWEVCWRSCRNSHSKHPNWTLKFRVFEKYDFYRNMYCVNVFVSWYDLIISVSPIKTLLHSTKSKFTIFTPI